MQDVSCISTDASRAGILRSLHDRVGPPRHSDIVLSLDSDYSVTVVRLTTRSFRSISKKDLRMDTYRDSTVVYTYLHENCYEHPFFYIAKLNHFYLSCLC